MKVIYDPKISRQPFTFVAPTDAGGNTGCREFLEMFYRHRAARS